MKLGGSNAATSASCSPILRVERRKRLPTPIGPASSRDAARTVGGQVVPAVTSATEENTYSAEPATICVSRKFGIPVTLVFGAPAVR